MYSKVFVAAAFVAALIVIACAQTTPSEFISYRQYVAIMAQGEECVLGR